MNDEGNITFHDPPIKLLQKGLSIHQSCNIFHIYTIKKNHEFQKKSKKKGKRKITYTQPYRRSKMRVLGFEDGMEEELLLKFSISILELRLRVTFALSLS